MSSSLFFTFVKMLMWYLLFRFIVSDGFNVLTNLMQVCENDLCKKDFQIHCSVLSKAFASYNM